MCSPDGKLLAIGGSAGIWLYDTETHQERALLTGHIGGVNSLSLSADGATLASAGRDRTIRVWDVPTATLKATLIGGDGDFESVTISADGTRIAACGRNDWGVYIWDAAIPTPKARLIDHTADIEGSPNEEGLLPLRVKRVSLRADGTLLASISANLQDGSQTISIWDVPTTTRLATHTELGAGNLVALNADGTLLASGGHGYTLNLWDAKTLTKKASVAPHDVSPSHSSGADVSCLSWNKDGTLLASGRVDGIIRIWDITNTAPILKATLVEYEGRGPITGLSWNADSTLLASATSRGRVCLWDIKTTIEKPIPTEYMVDPYDNPHSLLSRSPIRVLTGYMGGLESLSLNADGTRLVSCNYNGAAGIVRVWDVKRATLRKTLNPHFIKKHSRMVVVSFAPDNERIAIGTSSGTIYLWNPHTGSLEAILTGQKGVIKYFGWSADSTTLATAGWSETVHLWDVENARTKAVLTEYEERAVQSLSLNADGTRLAVGSEDPIVRIWDVKTDTPILKATLRGHDDISSVNYVSLNADGTRLTTVASDRTVRLWDVENATQTAIFTYRLGGIYPQQLNAKGTELAIGEDYNHNGIIIVWDVPPITATHKTNSTEIADVNPFIYAEMLEVKTVFLGHANRITDLSWSADGTTLASASEDNTILLWEINALPNYR